MLDSPVFGRSGGTQTRGLMNPNHPRYQLRYTPIVIKLWSCRWSNLWSNTVLTAFYHFPKRPKSARLKGFRRFSLLHGANTVYAPKPPALPTAPHLVVLCFLVCFLLIGFLLSIRDASLRNIVAALRPTEGQTPQEPFKFTRDILPFLARFVNLDEGVIGGKKIRACIFRNLTSGR